MNTLRERLNEIERRHPLAYAAALLLACDFALFIAIKFGEFMA